MRLGWVILLTLGLLLSAVPATAKRKAEDTPKSPYEPAWADVKPTRTVTQRYNAKQSPEQNGGALKSAMQGLKPGEKLEIEPGTYSIDAWFKLDIEGTEKAPIWICASETRGSKSGDEPEFEQVIITRPDVKQNLMNVGVDGPARYVCFRGLEFTGGAHGIRLNDCENVWIDRCHLHGTSEVAISANTKDTAFLYITRNDIHDTAGTGEGMYLGANDGKAVMHDCVIALNHVHDIGGDKVSQGDGIEVKQGSYGNLIAENVVHDTAYPCIIAYGTNGRKPNIIERNVCWNSGDNVMQVQGEAIVRNNLLINGNGAGFSSHDHQGKSCNLQVIHNTIISSKRGAKFSSWNAREGMVFANNAVYSEGTALDFSAGSEGVTLAGNVVFGGVSGASSGFITGRGLSDFADIKFDATARDAAPGAASALLAAADKQYATEADIHGEPRKRSVAGCIEK
ncbi:MAG: right-handed parallel beta-helix repeat-containing protein [Planctomycetes bacterium]|nr:right-handed parallel beta-helix repeat-containing protein [Planctomycetota bacterium]